MLLTHRTQVPLTQPSPSRGQGERTTATPILACPVEPGPLPASGCTGGPSSGSHMPPPPTWGPREGPMTPTVSPPPGVGPSWLLPPSPARPKAHSLSNPSSPNPLSQGSWEWVREHPGENRRNTHALSEQCVGSRHQPWWKLTMCGRERAAPLLRCHPDLLSPRLSLSRQEPAASHPRPGGRTKTLGPGCGAVRARHP